MAFTVEPSQPAPHIIMFRVLGDVDHNSFDILDATLTDAIEEGAKNIFVDLSRVAYMSSAGMGVLIGNMNKIMGEGGAFILINPTDGVREVFDTMGFSEFFEVCPTYEEAARRVS